MENNKTKDQAQSSDSLAAVTIDEVATEEAEKVATAIPKQEDYDKRIKLCKYWSIILGLCVVLAMIVLPFCLPASADLGVITSIMFSLAALYCLIILVAIIITGITIESSFKRKKHAPKDYLIIGIGVIMMLSPLIYFYSVSIIRRIGWGQ